jgi:hypothetical protein
MKNVLVALTIGYVLGAKTGAKELEQFNRSLTALFGTDEFAEVVASARSQVGSSLREVAAMIDGGHHVPLSEVGGDLVAKVRSLVGND